MHFSQEFNEMERVGIVCARTLTFWIGNLFDREILN